MKNPLRLTALFSSLVHNVLNQYSPDNSKYQEKKDAVQHPKLS